MKIKYLGTAAAEGIPAIFCTCETCMDAMKKGGRNIKTRQQAIIDDKLLLDFGPDTYSHVLKYNVPIHKIHHILITHSHGDHFYPDELLFRADGFATKLDEGPLYVYGGKSVVDKVNQIRDEKNMPNRLQGVLLEPFTETKILDYSITSVRANHDQSSNPFNFIIRKDGKSLFYAHDTTFPKDEWFDFLEQNCKEPLTLLSLDLTGGFQEKWYQWHLSLDTFIEVIDILKKRHIIDEKTIIIASHVSHNGHANHDELQKALKPYNVILAYDGMEVEF